MAESARSMMITCAVSPTFSLMQMNLSDSMVRVAKPICCTLMPTFWSYGKEGRREGGRGEVGLNKRKSHHINKGMAMYGGRI